MGRKINDGDLSGIKQDRFRNSRFEMESLEETRGKQGFVSKKTANTLGGPFDENRGHRFAEDSPNASRENPFENGRLYNWNKRQGWDQYFERQDRGHKKHGGAQMFHDLGHQGKGPKGYKRLDEAIYEDVCSMLEQSRDVDASDIVVSVKEGCVYLDGTVQSREEKKMAELEIENISGVKDVQNLLRPESLSREIQ